MFTKIEYVELIKTNLVHYRLTVESNEITGRNLNLMNVNIVVHQCKTNEVQKMKKSNLDKKLVEPTQARLVHHKKTNEL